MNRVRGLLVASWLLVGCVDKESRSVDEPTGELTGWFLSGAAQQSYRVSIDASVKHGGGASGKLEWAGGEASSTGAGTLMQSVPADAYREKRVRFTAWVRTSDVRDWAGLWMRIEREHGRARFDNMQTRPLGGTAEWERHAVVLDVPADATAISFGLLLNGPGVSWIDDASIEIVGSEVAVTELDTRPLALADGDFEAASEAWLLTGVARDDFRVSLDGRIVHGGKASLSLESIVERPRGYAQAEEVIRAERFLGKRIRVSAWVRAEAVVDHAAMSVIVLGPNAPPTSPGLSSAGFADEGTFDWKKFELVLDVAEQADSIVVGFGMKSAGKLWADDVQIEIVGTDVPVSNVDTRPAAIVNPTLDEGSASPTGWFVSGGARSHYAAVVDKKTFRQGVASARFAPSVAEPQGYGTLMQRFRAHDKRGTRVRMTAFVKGKDVDRRGDFWLRVQGVDSPGDGPGLSGGGCALAGTFDWKPCEIVFDVAQMADAIDVGIGTTGHGTIWLDDVRFDEVGFDVPLTHPRDTAPRALDNGAFDADATKTKGWFLSGGGAEDFSATVDGGAARLSARPALDHAVRGYGTLMQSVRAIDYVGKRLKLRARVRGRDLAEGDVWLRVQSAASPGDGPGLGGGTCPLEGSFDWKTCEIVFDVPDSASSIQVGTGIRGEGKGAVWLDDVVLEEVDLTTRPTDLVRERGAPDNMGFEG